MTPEDRANSPKIEAKDNSNTVGSISAGGEISRNSS